MDDAVRDALVELCRAHGTDMLDDPAKLEAFLRDTCPGWQREIHCLVGAVRDGAVKDLRGRDLAPEAAETLLAARLRDDLSMQDEAADWTARSLVAALATEPPPAPQASDPESGPVESEPERQPEVVNSELAPQSLDLGQGVAHDLGVTGPLAARAEVVLPQAEVAALQTHETAPAAESDSMLDAGSLSGDLRPEDYTAAQVLVPARDPAVASESEPLRPSAAQQGRQEPRRRRWAIGLATVVVVLVAAAVIWQSANEGPAPDGSSVTGAPETGLAASTSTTAASADPPSDLFISPGDSVSLSQACAEVGEGGTVHLGAGTYESESFTLTDSVTVVGEGSSRTRVVLTGRDSYGNAAHLSVAGGVTFAAEGLQLRHRQVAKKDESLTLVWIEGDGRLSLRGCRMAGGIDLNLMMSGSRGSLFAADCELEDLLAASDSEATIVDCRFRQIIPIDRATVNVTSSVGQSIWYQHQSRGSATGNRVHEIRIMDSAAPKIGDNTGQVIHGNL